jgi:hypothetical protein
MKLQDRLYGNTDGVWRSRRCYGAFCYYQKRTLVGPLRWLGGKRAALQLYGLTEEGIVAAA